jgi:hypothetical protein
MFLIVAALVLPLLVALAAIRPADIDFARSCGAAHPDAATQPARTGHPSLWKSPEVLTFAASLFLFQLANAAMLPVVIGFGTLPIRAAAVCLFRRPIVSYRLSTA